jgi:hypothetical protein
MRFQLLIAAVSVATAVPLFAHHSYTAEYDIADTVELKGTLSSFEWVNPHSYLTIAVKDFSGVTKLWRIEGGPIWFLMDNGWSPEMLQEMIKSRDAVVVTGYRARKPPGAGFGGGALGTEIKLRDGRKMVFHE